ncbi:MAG: hypothetical protein KAI57_04505 [Candidatus Pacebacteria bacterium]|nr:hypothetical protein [Candidatus Paceibacterota bacterium]
MFGLFKKKEQKKDPVCGMIANDGFISKYGEKFCSESCLKKYEEDNQITDDKGCGGSCCG